MAEQAEDLDSDTRFSNTASVMLSALYPTSREHVLANIKADIADPKKVHKIEGYDDVYVARGHGLQVVFTVRDGMSEVTSVAAQAE